MIYLDNAATTLHKPPCVINAVVNAMQTMGNSGRSAHAESLAASRTIYAAREALAALFGCERADHVCFTANSTEALNIAISGLLAPGDHVLSTDLEHNSVLRPLYREMERGVSVSFLPADRKGCIDYADFDRLLQTNTKAVICTAGSNLTGNLLDLTRIGAFCAAHGLLFVVDASQTAGVFPIDLRAQHISVLCFTGHKSLMGPQGTGGLCVAEGVDIRPWCVGGTGVQTFLPSQPPQYPTRLEAGTRNGHGIAGLLAAVHFIQEAGMDAIRTHELALARRFYEGVKDVDGVCVYGDFSDFVRAPVVSLNIRDAESSMVADALAEDYDIAVRAGAHCAPRMHGALGTVEQARPVGAGIDLGLGRDADEAGVVAMLVLHALLQRLQAVNFRAGGRGDGGKVAPSRSGRRIGTGGSLRTTNNGQRPFPFRRTPTHGGRIGTAIWRSTATAGWLTCLPSWRERTQGRMSAGPRCSAD